MDTARSILRLALPATKRSGFVLVVSMVMGVMAASSGALQLLGGIRAANESSESSECETSERIHVAVLQTRQAKTKGRFLCNLQAALDAADSHHSVRQVLTENCCRLSPIAYWSATMRC
jgi:hypothetical protein